MSSNRSKDRASLCSFSFADGRQCLTPRCTNHPHLCSFHARKEAQATAAQQAGRDISACFSGGYLSACDLSAALGQLFSAVAEGKVKPRTATTLAYLSQTLLQTIQLAQHEYINAFDTDSWRDAIRSSFAPSDPE
jgi:Tfp pilus assembly protein PilF